MSVRTNRKHFTAAALHHFISLCLSGCAFTSYVCAPCYYCWLAGSLSLNYLWRARRCVSALCRRCGDRLLAVDGHSLESVKHATAVKMLKQTGTRVTLEVVSWLGTELWRTGKRTSGTAHRRSDTPKPQSAHRLASFWIHQMDEN